MAQTHQYRCNKCGAISINPRRCPDKNCKGKME